MNQCAEDRRGAAGEVEGEQSEEGEQARLFESQASEARESLVEERERLLRFVEDDEAEFELRSTELGRSV